jgi:N-acetylglucosaminylphosphatidylinositol deacetylase
MKNSISTVQHVKPQPALLIVIAHPDDESIFFVPAIDALQSSKMCSETHILCCSTGNSEGKGSIRAGELVSAAKVLNINEKNIAILDHYALRDGMLEKWDSLAVATAVSAAVRKIIESQGNSRKGNSNSNSAGVCIVTFDAKGISGHPNHSAVFRGVEEFLQSSADLYMSSNHVVVCYKLETVSILRKFSSIFDISTSFCIHLLKKALTTCNYKQKNDTYPKSVDWPDNLLLIGGGIKLTHLAMIEHKSQYIWWRQLFVIFSRYSFINTLSRMYLVKETSKGH